MVVFMEECVFLNGPFSCLFGTFTMDDPSDFFFCSLSVSLRFFSFDNLISDIALCLLSENNWLRERHLHSECRCKEIASFLCNILNCSLYL